MITKVQADAIYIMSSAIVIALLGMSTYFSNNANACSSEVIQLFMNRSDEEFRSVVDLSDRNTYYALAVVAKADDDDALAQSYIKGGEGSQNFARERETKLFWINQDMFEKKLYCDSVFLWSNIFVILAIIVSVFNVYFSSVMVARTKF